MIAKGEKLKEKLKTLVKDRENRYKKLSMEKSPIKKRNLAKTIANLFLRVFTVFVRFIFKNIIYGEKGQSMPPIKNLLLLEPASVLALKIRTKKVGECAIYAKGE